MAHAADPGGLPLRIGVIHDFPASDGGAAFEWAVRRGCAEVEASGRLPGPLEFLHQPALGLPLPGGSAHSVEQAFERLEEQGVLAILGPAITDNAIVALPLSARAGLPCINYAGDEEARGEFMFHFQIGSLEEEPSFLAAHLTARGLARVALIQDSSHVGRRLADFFEGACAAAGAELAARSLIRPDGAGADRAVATVRRAEPQALAFLGMWASAHAVAQARAGARWDVPAVANSALIYGHVDPAWARDWEGWTYTDTVSDGNRRYRALCAAAGAAGLAGGPGQAGAFDMGRLLAEGIARAPYLTRAGVARGLERVKALPAATGCDGTLMGFGQWDRGALKGRYLVLRQWRAGSSVELEGSA